MENSHLDPSEISAQPNIDQTPIPAPMVTTSTLGHQNNSKQMTLLVTLLILFIGLSVFLGYQYLKNDTPIQAPPLTSVTPTTFPQPSMTDTANATDFPVLEPKNVYQLSLSLKNATSLPNISYGEDGSFNGVVGYLNSMFKIPTLENQAVFKLFFDSRSSSPYSGDSSARPLFPLFNMPVYLVVDTPIELKATYEDSYSTVTTSPQDQSIYPYLIKPDYCKADGDCIIGNNGCTVGAYNYYSQFIDGPWGCGPPSYKNSWPSYGSYSDELGCQTEMMFSAAKCMDNVCIEVDPQRVCLENQSGLP